MSDVGLPVKLRVGPDGLHLFDRRTGLNMLFDEIEAPEEQWSRAPRQVSIALTNACDLACSFCYAPKNGRRAWSLVASGRGRCLRPGRIRPPASAAVDRGCRVSAGSPPGENRPSHRDV